MKKNLFIIAFVFLFVDSSFAIEKPNWVYNSDEECPKENICSTGSGISPNTARTDARNNILRYFETSINSKFVSTLSSDEENIKNFTSEDNQELTSGILKGVKIEKNYDDGKIYYAFAVLDKKIAVKEITNDVEKIDSKMQLLLLENNSKYNKQLEKLYLKRENLNNKYLILTSEIIPEIVKYEDIFKSKQKNKKDGLVFYVEPFEGYTQQVNDYLISLLLDEGAKISSDKALINRIIVVTINKNNLHLNVDGFIKQMYILKIEVSNPNGEVISSLYKEFVEIGRSEDQVRELVNMRIKEYIQENAEELANSNI